MATQDIPVPVISLIGYPGAGKTTLANRCRESLDVKVLSVGNVLRDHVARKTSIGIAIERTINAGHLVPEDTLQEIVTLWLTDNAVHAKPIILDGFPRSILQARLILEVLQKNFQHYSMRVVQLLVTDDALVARLHNRLVCSNTACQAVFSIQSTHTKSCIACGHKLIKRRDDDVHTIRERIAVCQATLVPLLDFYHAHRIRIDTIDTAYKTPQQVFEAFLHIF